MKTVTGLSRVVRLAVISLAIFIACVSQANAMLVFEEVEFIDEPEAESEQFFIKQPGLYELTLIDFEFPVAFELLSVQLTRGAYFDGDQSFGLTEVNRLSGPGSFTFEAGFAGSYYANIFAIPGSNLGAGLFGLQLTQLNSEISHVPLPPAFLFLLSGLVALFGLKKKQQV